MQKCNIDRKLIDIIINLYDKASNAILRKLVIGKEFPTKTGVRQGCLLSPTLFILFLEDIMQNTLCCHNRSIKMKGRLITNLRLTDDIDSLAGSEDEPIYLSNKISESASKFGMEINTTKTKLILNGNTCNPTIIIQNEHIKIVNHFKYLVSIIDEQGSRKEILDRAEQANDTLRHIRLGYKLRLMNSLVTLIFLYACEIWTLTLELETRIRTFESKNFRKLLGVTYKDSIINDEIRTRISQAGRYTDLLTIVK